MENFDTMIHILLAISSTLSFMLYAGWFTLLKRTLCFTLVGIVMFTPVWLLEQVQVITL